MRVVLWSSPVVLAATFAFAATKPKPPPRVDALDLDHGTVLLEQPASHGTGVSEWSAFQLTDGRDEGGWCSPEGAPQGASFVWELDTTWRLDTLALSTKGVEEKTYPGISAKTVELFVAAATGPWTSIGRFTIGTRERREYPLPPDTKAARVRIVVLENHGNATYTELSEVNVYGERSEVIRVPEIEGDFNTNLGPLRFARHGDQIVGCFELDGGDVAFLSGTLTGRLARVSWHVTSEAGTTEGNAVFAISAAAGQLHGVTYRNGKLDDEMTGVRVPASRGPKCVPTPSVQSPTSG